MTKKTKVLATSIASIAMCASIAVGGTFALFTSESEVNVAVTSGKVKMNALVDTQSVALTSLGEAMTGTTWANGGFASVSGGEVVLTNVTPGDKITFNIDITNESTVNVQYRTVVSCVEGLDLFSGLVVTLEYANDVEDSQTFNGLTAYGNWNALTPQTADADVEDVDTVKVTIELPNRSNGLVFGEDNLDNQYQGLSTKLNYRVEAVQGNAGVTDDVADANTTLAYTANDMELIARQVNSGANSFNGKTVKLMNDITLATTTTFALNSEAESNWTPIGNGDHSFQGTFDGQGYTLKNLYLNKPGEKHVGMFGFTTEGEIKNLVVENATVIGENSVGVVAGTPYTSKYSNITVKGDVIVEGKFYVGGVGGRNAYANWDNITVDVNDGSYVLADSVEDGIAYRTYVGGVIGFMGEGNHVVSNVTSNIDVIGSTIDVGGIVGIAHYGNTFKNCYSNGDVTVTGAESAADAEEIGGIAGVWMDDARGAVTFADCVFEGTLSANITDGVDLSDNTIVGKAYNENGTGTLDVYNFFFEDGVQYVKDGVSGEVGLYLVPADYEGDKVEVAEGVDYIGNYAFAYNSNVKTVILSSTVRDLGRGFDSAPSVEKVVLNEGLTTISSRAFKATTNLKEVVFSSTVTTVADNAFQKSGLKNIVFPANVTFIGDSAFTASAIETVVMKAEVMHVARFAFRDCPNLASVTIDAKSLTLGAGMIFTPSQNNNDANDIKLYVVNEDVKAVVDANGTFKGTIICEQTANQNGVYEDENGNSYAYANDDTTLNSAIANGAETVYLGSGSYIIPDSAQGKTLKIVGNGDTKIATQDDGSYEGCDYSLDGATVVFEGVVINTDSSTYTGYARLKATYNNCTINGTYTLYDNSEFNNCTFNVSGDVYNVWTWGAPNATFNGCTFNSDGKAILLYGGTNTNLTVNGCTFNDNGGLTDLKAAIEVGTDWTTNAYTLTVNNTVVNGYEINDKGINTGTTLWANKNSMSQEVLNVVVDGVDVY